MLRILKTSGQYQHVLFYLVPKFSKYKVSLVLFCQRLSRSQGHSAAGKMK